MWFAVSFLSLYFLMYWNKMESGMCGANVVPMKESNNIELKLIFIVQTQLKCLNNFKCFTITALYGVR